MGVDEYPVVLVVGAESETGQVVLRLGVFLGFKACRRVFGSGNLGLGLGVSRIRGSRSCKTVQGSSFPVLARRTPQDMGPLQSAQRRPGRL